jgi:TonB-linked SusC/RagA family outer membrane protein
MSYWASFNQENTLTYSFKLLGEHNFVAMIGNSIEKNQASWNMGESMRNSIYGDWAHAYIDNTPGINSTNATFAKMNGKNGANWSMMSYYGRINYDYKETILFSAMLRADGSSSFPSNKRWGYFPSVSAGYVLTQAPFMSATSSWLNFLKIRASFGQVGNQSIPQFLYTSTIAYLTYPNANSSFQNWTYPFGNSLTVRSLGSEPARVPNPNIGWETSQQVDAGLDARLLNSRLSATFDYYQKITKDWLVLTAIDSYNGIPSMQINGGNVKNSGIELSLSWNDKIGDIKYNATVSLANNKNKVTKIANTEKVVHGPSNVLSQGTTEIYRAQEGYPIGFFYGYKTAGVIQNQAEADAWVNANGVKYFADQKPGDLKFVDTNGDGIIDTKDQVMIGDPNPDYILGIQLGAEYKGIYFNATLTGAYGQQIAKSYRSFADSYKNNYTTDVFGRWHGEGTSNTLPELNSSPNRNSQFLSDIYIHNGNYMKISNLTVGYNFKELAKNMPFTEARLFVTAKNLYTFTKYDGMDPEVGSDGGSGNSWARGVDLGLFPSARTFLVGLSLKF